MLEFAKIFFLRFLIISVAGTLLTLYFYFFTEANIAPITFAMVYFASGISAGLLTWNVCNPAKSHDDEG